MNKEEWDRIQTLFESALQIPSEQREQFLQSLDITPNVLEEVLSMVQAHDSQLLVLESSARTFEAMQQPPSKLGNYRIVREIGQGGMGKVYLGKRDDGAFEREVAIKILSQVTSTEVLRERFNREIHIHAQLEHPNIAHLLDASISTQGAPYLVMQYVNGVPITEFISNHQCSIEERVRLIIQVCDAVAFAHGQLILHRDIKPSNILVTEEGQVVLLDFGIAKLLKNEEQEQTLTRVNDQIATLAYASPEQISQQGLTTGSDVYSLGTILYELLTGHRPFVQSSTPALFEDVLKKDAVPPHMTGEGDKVPVDLQAICLKSLEKRVSDRYASASDLSADLRRFLNHETVTVRKPGLWDRIQKFWHRHPIAAPFTILASIVIVSSLILALWQTEQANRQKDIAIHSKDRSEQLSELILDLFYRDPFNPPGERRADITLQTFLIDKTQYMEDKLQDQPDLQAMLFDVLARINTSMGQLDIAQSLAESALETRRTLLGNKHDDVAKSLYTLGLLRAEQGRTDEALTLAREALAIRKQIFPPGHNAILEGASGVFEFLVKKGDPKDRDELFALGHWVLAMREKQNEPDTYATVRLLNNLAIAYTYRREGNDFDIAEDMLHRVLRARGTLGGDKHPFFCRAMINLSHILIEKSQFAEAEMLLLEAQDLAKVNPGEDSLLHLQTLGNLGVVYVERGDLAEAEVTFQETLTRYRSLFPENHIYVVQTLGNLGDVYIKQGRFVEAESVFQKVLTGFRALLPEDHIYNYYVLTNLTEIYIGMGNKSQALYFLGQLKKGAHHIDVQKDIPELEVSIDQM